MSAVKLQEIPEAFNLLWDNIPEDVKEKIPNLIQLGKEGLEILWETANEKISEDVKRKLPNYVRAGTEVGTLIKSYMIADAPETSRHAMQTKANKLLFFGNVANGVALYVEMKKFNAFWDKIKRAENLIGKSRESRERISIELQELHHKFNELDQYLRGITAPTIFHIFQLNDWIEEIKDQFNNVKDEIKYLRVKIDQTIVNLTDTSEDRKLAARTGILSGVTCITSTVLLSDIANPLLSTISIIFSAAHIKLGMANLDAVKLTAVHIEALQQELKEISRLEEERKKLETDVKKIKKQIQAMYKTPFTESAGK